MNSLPRRTFLKTSALGLGATLSPRPAPAELAASGKKRPNILLIVTDQQRADTIGALGNPLIKTPTLDSLCEQGTAFTRAYTPAPICSPARVAMATGIEPHRHRFTDHDWFHNEADRLPGMPRDPSFMTLLNRSGYQTFFSGKVHHSGRSWLFDGVEEFSGSEPRLPASTRVLGDYGSFCDEKGYRPFHRPSMSLRSEYYMVPQTTQAPVEHTLSSWMADECLAFLRRRDRDRPFLMQCHFPEPHPPITNPMPFALLYRNVEVDNPHRPESYKAYQARPNRYQNRYKGRDTAQEDDTVWRTIKAAYYGNISLIDYNIGRILDALGPERDNTLIVFTSDHGEMMGDYGCAGKRCMLEASARIPFIASLPGAIPQGKIQDTPVSLLDLFPTFMDAAGIEAPTRSEESRSILDFANVRSEAGKRLVFSQFSSDWCGQYGVSDGQWKYSWSAPDRQEWLVRLDDALHDGPNLANDPKAAPHKDRLKSALIQRHHPSADPWSNAVENDDWKPHLVPPETWHDDPTYGMLSQDRNGQALQDLVDQYPAYRRPVLNRSHGNLHEDHRVCGGISPWI